MSIYYKLARCTVLLGYANIFKNNIQIASVNRDLQLILIDQPKFLDYANLPSFFKRKIVDL